jgi:tetratricopeptide (TPR) repeat protein
MLFILSFVGALVTGCGGKHPGKYETLVSQNKDATTASTQITEADALWEERADVEKLKQAITKYEQAIQANPSDRYAHERLIRGTYFLADGFTDGKDEKIALFLSAIEWGKRCLAINADFATRINGGEKEKDAVVVATQEDGPCLYWTASALGKWAKANGIAKALKHIPTVKAYISKVEEMDGSYWHHGPTRYWGAYYSVLPGFAGRDLEKSASYFEQTLKDSPNYLGSYVLRAEHLAVTNQDIKQFDADLKTVLEFDLNAQPDLMPENEREQLKAKRLIELRSELFEKKVLEQASQ